MSEDAVLNAVQKFIDAVNTRMKADREENESLRDELRSLRDELQTRASQVVEGPPGPPGKDGRDGVDGKDGKDGTPGERGADGLATPEQIEALITQEVEKRFADLQVRTFADVYRGVFKPGDTYTRGSVVTWDGSAWLAKEDTQQKPGDKNADWTLIVKRGRDR